MQPDFGSRSMERSILVHHLRLHIFECFVLIAASLLLFIVRCVLKHSNRVNKEKMNLETKSNAK